jgi:hypothetical protein
LNLNAWIQRNGNKPAFVRTVAPHGLKTIRGVLSDKYAPIDDFDLLGHLRNLPALQTATVRMFEYGEETSHLRLTWPQDRREVKRGDVVEFGVHISNSEIGSRSVRIEPIIYRLVCANGLISADENTVKWNIRHIGNRARVQNAVMEAIATALPEAQAMAARLREAVTQAVDAPVGVLKAIAREEKLTEDMVNAAMEELMKEAAGGVATRYDLVNSLTGAGRRQADSEKRYELEKLGARYLSRALPAPVAEAA